MFEDILNEIRQHNGIIVETEFGNWELKAHEAGIQWELIHMSEAGYELLGELTVRLDTKFSPNTSALDYRLFFGERPVSSGRVSVVRGGNLKSFDDYASLMERILSSAGESIMAYGETWLQQLGGRKATPVTSTDEPAPAPKIDLQAALDSGDEAAIIKAAKSRPRLKADEIIDIYSKAQELRSNRLMNLVHGLRTESLAESLVLMLLGR